MTVELLNPLGPRTRLTRNFYYRDSIYYLGQHLGGDYVRTDRPTRGAPIIASGGMAMASPLFDYYRGWMVKNLTPSGWLIGTAHLLSYKIPVNVWVPVEPGQEIGWADSSGVSTGDHAHVDLWHPTKQSPEAVFKLGYWAHDPELYLGKEMEDDVSAKDVLDAYRTQLPELGNRSLLDVTRVSEDYVSSQVANIEASIARAKGDTVGEAKALEWKAFYDAKINGQPIPPPV